MRRTAAALLTTAGLSVLAVPSIVQAQTQPPTQTPIPTTTTPPTSSPPTSAPPQQPQPQGGERSRWTSPAAVDVSPATLRGIAVDPRGIGVTGVAFAVAAGEPEGDPCRPTIASDRTGSAFADGTGERGQPVPFETAVSFPCNGSWSVVARIGYRRPQVAAESEDVPLPVTVAVAPATPTLRADRAPVGVALRWTPNEEPDLRTYKLERSDDSGATWTDLTAGFEVRETSVVDDTAPPQPQTRYRVSAVRGRPSVPSVASPASPEVTVPAESSAAGSSPTFGSTLGQLQSRATSSVAVPPPPPASIDDTFDETLPFAPPPPPAPGPAVTEPPGESPVVAILDGVTGADKKALATPFAAALVLVLLAAHLRHLTRRAFDPPAH